MELLLDADSRRVEPSDLIALGFRRPFCSYFGLSSSRNCGAAHDQRAFSVLGIHLALPAQNELSFVFCHDTFCVYVGYF